MADKSLSLQDQFLNTIRKHKVPVTIFLVKGVKLQGIVTWFDPFSLLLRRDGNAAGLQACDFNDHAGESLPDLQHAGGGGRQWQEGDAPGPVPAGCIARA